MDKVEVVVVQVLLLHTLELWVISQDDMNQVAIRLANTFEKGMKKQGYLNRSKLQRYCRLFVGDEYISRRGTLQAYLQKNMPKLVEEALLTKNHSRDFNKVLQWNRNFNSEGRNTKMVFYLIDINSIIFIKKCQAMYMASRGQTHTHTLSFQCLRCIYHVFVSTCPQCIFSVIVTTLF